MKTVLTSSGFTPARSKAALMTSAPSRGPGKLESEPWKAPMGVRAAPTITTSLNLRSVAMGMLLDLGGGVHNPFRAVKRRSLCYVGAPMSHAGDLTRVEFDRLLDQGGGPAVVVHGGAGTPPTADPARYFEGTRRAAEAGLRVLVQGGSALDAAQAAAVVLEDDPSFNAGTGAALTSSGEVELDASCMDGTSLRAGAVACVKTVKNPILLARRVCDDTPHVLICARGAEAFARECGIAEVPNATMVTPRQWARWRELHAEAERVGADVVRKKIGTIGAVAVDAKG